MTNPALRLIGFGAAALVFLSVFAFSMRGEVQRQAMAQREQQAQQQRQRAEAQAQMRARPRRTEEPDEDWREQEYAAVRSQPYNSYDSSYRDARTSRGSDPRVVFEGNGQREDSGEQRRTEAEADRLTRDLDRRLYGR